MIADAPLAAPKIRQIASGAVACPPRVRLLLPRIQQSRSGIEKDMNYLKQLEEQIAAWPHISVHPHRFGGKEFRLGSAEVGHIHTGGAVDIPFPRSIRDALLEESLAEEHRWVPNSGWTTFYVHAGDDVAHAVWLMRLSYLRYALKTASDPHDLLKQESEQLHLSPQLTSLLSPFVPLTANRVSTRTALR